MYIGPSVNLTGDWGKGSVRCMSMLAYIFIYFYFDLGIHERFNALQEKRVKLIPVSDCMLNGIWKSHFFKQSNYHNGSIITMV